MFEQSIFSEPREESRKRWAFAGAFVAQVLVLGVIVAIPLLSLQTIPLPAIATTLVAPPPPPPLPPPAGPPAHTRAQASSPRVATLRLRHFDVSKLSEPVTVPKTVPTISDLPAAPALAGVAGGVAGGVPGGQVGGALGGILGGLPSAAPPPPPPAMAETSTPATPKVVQVGGAVEAARALSAPPPAYPALARSAGVEGTVRMDAVIGSDGHIQNLTLVSGNPLLVNAALAAVKQWTYRPTYLNGKAVKVATEIDVNFQLTS